ncbi:MAG: hypothetical protein HRU41_33635 [Saprospiraceae bacterium]|nr:hypothetical protein [Saprospiraceae bacterium]
MKLKLSLFLFLLLSLQGLAQRQYSVSVQSRIFPATDQLTARASPDRFFVSGPQGPVHRTSYSYAVYDAETGLFIQGTPRGHFTWAQFAWRPGVNRVIVRRWRWERSESGALVAVWRGETLIQRPG